MEPTGPWGTGSCATSFIAGSWPRHGSNSSSVGSRWPRGNELGDSSVRTWSRTGGRVRALIVVAHVLAAFGLWGSRVPPASAQLTAQPTQQKEPVRPTVAPIPIPEIAQRAEQVTPLLRGAEQIAGGSDVQDIEAELPAAGEWIRGRVVGTTQALASSPSANALATLSDSWRVMRSKLAAWNDTLTRRATQLEQGLEQLEA